VFHEGRVDVTFFIFLVGIYSLMYRKGWLSALSKDIEDEDIGFENIAAISRIIYDHQQQLPAANLKLPPLE
jgi:hypothetical protein